MEKLDLHGTKHADVRRKVIRFVEKNWDSGEDYEIITGHSTRMKDIVIDVLDEYSLLYVTDSLLTPHSPVIIVVGV